MYSHLVQSLAIRPKILTLQNQEKWKALISFLKFQVIDQWLLIYDSYNNIYDMRLCII